jgi:hypothetical protein
MTEGEIIVLREKAFTAELVLLSVTLPLLRVVPPEVSATLLLEIRRTLPPLIDGAPFDPARISVHVGELADQIETILASEVARGCPN